MSQTREPTETRRWGAFYLLDEGCGFKVKRIVVTPGGRLSLQSQKHRAEHWTVMSGQATVTVDESIRTLEVQLGKYLGEGHIVRYDDVSQRG